MAPLSVTVPPVTMVPFSVSVLVASTVSWVLLSASLLIELSPMMSMMPRLLIAPPLSATPLRFSVLVASTLTVPLDRKSVVEGKRVGSGSGWVASTVTWPPLTAAVLIAMSPVTWMAPLSVTVPPVTMLLFSVRVLFEFPVCLVFRRVLFRSELSPMMSMMPRLLIAPPLSATPLRFSVLVASTLTVPLDRKSVVEGKRVGSGSGWVASTVTWPPLTAAVLIAMSPVTWMAPLSVTVPPVTMLLFSVRVLFEFPVCLVFRRVLFRSELSPMMSMMPRLLIAPPLSATPLRFSVLVASTLTVPLSAIVVPVTSEVYTADVLLASNVICRPLLADVLIALSPVTWMAPLSVTVSPVTMLPFSVSVLLSSSFGCVLLRASFPTRRSSVLSMMPRLLIAPPLSATPLRFSVLVASTLTVPLSAIVVPV